MSSPEHQNLAQAVAELKAKLMGFPPSHTGEYSDTELLMCQAFVVFSHAELQVYLESVALRILSEAERKWLASKEVGRVVATLVAFRRPANVSVPKNNTDPPNGGKFEWIFESAVKAQREIIDKNNGIKRANIAEMFLPLGVFLSDLAEPLLIQLDQTGKKRGDMVHKSSRVSLQTIRDPFSDEVRNIDDLIAEIGAFDTKLEALGLLSVPT